MFKFGIFEPQTQIIDPMGSVIVNTNATGSPNFEWIYKSEFGGYGKPYKELGSLLSYSDSVSYKIKLLNQIPKFGVQATTTTTTTTTTTSSSTTSSSTTSSSTSTSSPGSTTSTSSTSTSTSLAFASSVTSNNLSTLAANACYSSNPTTYGECLNGPYRIGSKLYYVDFRILYLVNLGTQPIYSPLFSVDTRKCTEDYGIFIGAPKIPSNFTVDANNTSTRIAIFDELPQYSNQVDLFNESINYKFTVVKPDYESMNVEEWTETLPISPANIQRLLLQITGSVDLNQRATGQTSLIAQNINSQPLVLSESQSNDVILENTSLTAKGYYPFVVFRYISSTCPTAPVEIAFTVAPSIG